MLLFLLFGSLFWSYCCGLKVDSSVFKVENSRIKDEYGRESYFHGVNVVFKSHPYLPVTDRFDANISFNTDDMALLQELGLNIIRLGVMWPGVSPIRSEYNQTYIDNAKQLIETANEYGIYSLVDCHQDVLSECVCGEGVPNWAVQPSKWNFPIPLALKPYDYIDADTHTPSRADCLSKSWAEYYMTTTVGQAFQSIYQNVNGLADEFANYWGVLARQFNGIDGILGFELLNEPWAGDVVHHPTLVWPGEADKKNLEPFYDRVVAPIYGNDSSRLVFFESVTWTDEFNASWTDAGFTAVPGGAEHAATSVYSFHYYNVPGGPNAGSKEKYFSERNSDALRWGAAAMLTEFDITNNDESEDVFKAHNEVLDVCDKHFISWIGWEYKPFAGALPDGTCTGCGYGLFLPNGKRNEMVSKTLSRTYAQSIAGKGIETLFDSTTGVFKLMYEIDTSISAPTVIYANGQYWYPNGFAIQVSPYGAVDITQTQNGNAYRIEFSAHNGVSDGTSVFLEISPLSST